MKKVLLASMMAMAMGGAFAQQAYVEGAIGMTNLSVDCEGAISCDKSDTGFKLLGGYKVTPDVAVELGYINFGKVKADFGLLGTAQLKNNAIYVGGALRGEFGNGFGGVARLGLANVNTKYSDSDGVSESESAMNLMFGLGADYAVAKNVKITAAIDFTKAADVADSGSDGTLRIISVGARFDF